MEVANLSHWQLAQILWTFPLKWNSEFTILCGWNGWRAAMDTAPDAADAADGDKCAVGTLWNPPMHSANWQPSDCSLSQPQPHFCASMHSIEQLTQILWFLGFQVSWWYQTCKSHDSPTADHSSRPHSSPNSGVFGSKCSPDSEQHSLSPSLSLCLYAY